MPKATHPIKRNKPCEDCRKRKSKCCIEPGATTCVMCRMREIPCSLRDRINPPPPVEPADRKSSSPWAPRNGATADAQSRGINDHNVSALDDLPAPKLIGGPHDTLAGRPVGVYEHSTLDRGLSRRVDRYDSPHMATTPRDSHSPTYSIKREHSARQDNDREFRLHTTMASKFAQALVRPHEDDLFRLYFRTYDSIFPILWHSAQHPRYAFPDTVPGTLLLGIYLASIMCINREHELSHWTPPTLDSVKNAFAFEVTKELGQPDIPTIQAILILLRLPHDTDDALVENAWQYICACFSAAQVVKLHLDPSDWQLPAWEKKLRRRLWWKIYIAEKWTALVLGHPSHIDDAEHTVSPLQLNDFHDDHDSPCHDAEEVISWNGAISMAHLSVILSNILKVFYSVRQRPIMENEILAIDSALGAWRGRHLPRLPLSGQLELGLLDTRVATVHLMMHTVAVAFYRGLLRIGQLGAQDRESGLLSVQCVTSLLQHLPVGQVDAYWPSYSRLSLALIASFLVKLVFRPTSEEQHFRDLEIVTAMVEALERHSTWPTVSIALHELRQFRVGKPNLVA